MAFVLFLSPLCACLLFINWLYYLLWRHLLTEFCINWFGPFWLLQPLLSHWNLSFAFWLQSLCSVGLHIPATPSHSLQLQFSVSQDNSSNAYLLSITASTLSPSQNEWLSWPACRVEYCYCSVIIRTAHANSIFTSHLSLSSFDFKEICISHSTP